MGEPINAARIGARSSGSPSTITPSDSSNQSIPLPSISSALNSPSAFTNRNGKSAAVSTTQPASRSSGTPASRKES